MTGPGARVKGTVIRGGTGVALVLALWGAAPAAAYMLSAESALLCPQPDDFTTVIGGGEVPTACVRAFRHEDLYGPIGRMTGAGGVLVRVRKDGVLYWAEESAFYPRTGTPLPRIDFPPPQD